MTLRITIRFYAELNDFLAAGLQKQDVPVDLAESLRVSGLITSLGVPVDSVDLILVNGHPAPLDFPLSDSDRVSVYPVFERLNIESVSRVTNSPLRHPSFICDVHLGRLAKYLRMLGFDTLYKNDYDDNELVRLSNSEQRILLSRDKALIADRRLTRRYELISRDTFRQVREVLDSLDLKTAVSPMSRCLTCNGLVEPVSRSNVKDRVDETIFRAHREFTRCRECGKIFWKGSHFESMMGRIAEITG